MTYPTEADRVAAEASGIRHERDVCRRITRAYHEGRAAFQRGYPWPRTHPTTPEAEAFLDGYADAYTHDRRP